MKSSLPTNKDDLQQQQTKKVSRIEYIVKIFLLLFVFAATFGTLFLFLQNRKQLPKIENGENDGALVPYDGESKGAVALAESKSTSEEIVRRLKEVGTLSGQKAGQNAANSSQPIAALTGATLLSDDGSYVATLEVGADKKLTGIFVRDVQDGKEVHVKYLASNFTPEETSQVITTLPATATSWECKKAPNGNIVLFWQDTDVFLQIFSSSFEQITVAKKINSYDINCGYYGGCCFTTDFFSDSSMLVVWHNPISSMRGQYLYSNGEKEGLEFPSGTECSEGIQYLSCPIDLSIQSNDAHMLVWGCGSSDYDAAPKYICSQPFSAAKEKQGGAQCWSEAYTIFSWERIKLIQSSSGGYRMISSIIRGNSDYPTKYVMSQSIDNSGQFNGTMEQLTSGSTFGDTNPYESSVVSLTSGGYVPMAMSPLEDHFIVGQYHNADDTVQGPIGYLVSTYGARVGSPKPNQISFHRFIVGRDVKINDTKTAAYFSSYLVNGMAAVNLKAEIYIPSRGAEVVLTNDNFNSIDPIGHSELLGYLLSKTHSTITDEQTKMSATDLIQDGIDKHLYRFKHDGSHYNPESTFYLRTASGIVSGPFEAQITLNDPNYPPEVSKEQKPANIAIYPWRYAEQDCSKTFSCSDSPLSVVLKATNGKPFSDEIHLTFNYSVTPPICKIGYSATDQFVTTPLELLGTCVREEEEVGESLSTSVFYSAVRTEPTSQTEDNGPSGWDKAKVIVPPLFSALGAFTTISCCLCSASLAAVIRLHNKQKVIQHSRDFDEFAKLVFNELGQPNSVKDFTTSDGRKFIAIVTGHIEITNPFHIPYATRNILTAIGIVEMPTSKKEQRKLAKEVAEAIKVGTRPTTSIIGTFKHPKLTVALIEQNFDRIIAAYGKNSIPREMEMVNYYEPPPSSPDSSGTPLLPCSHIEVFNEGDRSDASDTPTP